MKPIPFLSAPAALAAVAVALAPWLTPAAGAAPRYPLPGYDPAADAVSAPAPAPDTSSAVPAPAAPAAAAATAPAARPAYGAALPVPRYAQPRLAASSYASTYASSTPSGAASSGRQTPEAQIRQFVVEAASNGNGRVEVELGSLATGGQLAPCQRIEPFVPSGARLWGRSQIGVRCVEGASWSVSVPVNVRVFGTGLVAVTPLSVNAQISPRDFRVAEVELTRENGQPLAEGTDLAGKSLTRSLMAGQVLHADHLRILQTIAPGDPVSIRINGDGFSISADGFAMAGAGDGQNLRVRLDNGKVLSGTVHDRVVDVRL